MQQQFYSHARAECAIFESRSCSSPLFLPHFLSKNRFTLFGKCSNEVILTMFAMMSQAI